MIPDLHDSFILQLAVWVIIAIVVIILLVLKYLRRRGIEKIIRLAIERGQNLDAEMVANLLNPKTTDSQPVQFMLRGIIVFFVGLGLGALGFIINLGHTGTDVLYVMVGVGVLVSCVGLGMFVGSVILRKLNNGSRIQD